MRRVFLSYRFIISCFSFLFLIVSEQVFAQCKPIIKVDGIQTVVSTNDAYGVAFPFWLKAGQTLSIGSSVTSISVLEFSVSSNTLEFSQVLNITSSSPVSVPSGKVWKVEAAIKANNTSGYAKITYTKAGTYSWNVPNCAEQICIEAWGPGGGGSGNNGPSSIGGAGGGGGGYGAQCFAVTPGTTLTIVVGSGGTGGAGGSSPGNGNTGPSTTVNGTGVSLTVTGGSGGTYNGSGGTGGTGGTSSATSNAQGQTGFSGGTVCSSPGGDGGAGANGGAGGVGAAAAGVAGTAPGGGGSGTGVYGCGSNGTGGRGASGQVIITW